MSSRVRKTASEARPRSHNEDGDTGRRHQLKKNSALIELVESWLAEDSQRNPEEVQAEWEEFKSALDADRPSERKLFP